MGPNDCAGARSSLWRVPGFSHLRETSKNEVLHFFSSYTTNLIFILDLIYSISKRIEKCLNIRFLFSILTNFSTNFFFPAAIPRNMTAPYSLGFSLCPEPCSLVSVFFSLTSSLLTNFFFLLLLLHVAFQFKKPLKSRHNSQRGFFTLDNTINA